MGTERFQLAAEVTAAIELRLFDEAESHRFDVFTIGADSFVSGSEIAGAGAVVRAMDHCGKEVHERWDEGIDGPLDARDCRADVGLSEEVALLHGKACEILEAGVFVAEANDGADDGETVGDEGQAREHFGDLQSRDDSVDRVEFPADLFGSIGFEVKCVLMWQATGEVDNDDGFVALGRVLASFGAKESGESEPPRESASLEERTAGDAVTVAEFIAPESPHAAVSFNVATDQSMFMISDEMDIAKRIGGLCGCKVSLV